MKLHPMLAAAAGLSLIFVTCQAQAHDANAAKSLLKKNDCYKCHALSKKKDGPSFKEIAKNYLGDSGAPGKLYEHVTTGPTIEVDGKEEEHKIIKGSDDQINNMISWMLSL